MIHIIVVNHFHDDYIISLLNKIFKSESDFHLLFRVYIKDNINSIKLQTFCQNKNVVYISSAERSGFSRNNNLAVKKILDEYQVSDEDYFLFLNPDVLISTETLEKLSGILSRCKYDLFTVDLYKDEELSMRDPSVRHFPKLMDFFTSFFLDYNNSIIDRSHISEHIAVDWCAGSFLGIKCSVFNHLRGFDERFFMYCEDIDICIRAKYAGYKLVYLPELKVIHFSQSHNRALLSKNFFWHLKSLFYIYYKHMFKLW